MKELQISLYEVVGYFIPGLLALMGVYLFATALMEPRLVHLASVEDKRLILAIALAAYVTGHGVQALGNVALGWMKLDASALGAIPESVRSAVSDQLGARLGKPLPDAALIGACDAVLLHFGNADARDVYVYREGFYRGITVASVLLFAGIACSWAQWSWPIAPPSSSVFVLLLAFTAGLAALSFRRHVRFGKYRIEASIFGALAYLISQKPED